MSKTHHLIRESHDPMLLTARKHRDEHVDVKAKLDRKP